MRTPPPSLRPASVWTEWREAGPARKPLCRAEGGLVPGHRVVLRRGQRAESEGAWETDPAPGGPVFPFAALWAV